MKYPNMNLGRIEAIINKLGGEKGVEDFLAGRKILTEAPTPDKFGNPIELGTFTVPANYNHGTCIKKFQKDYKKNFWSWNDDSNDKNFKDPSHKLVPGKTYKVTAYYQLVPGSTTSEERLAFLRSKSALLVGAQGLTFVFKNDSMRQKLRATGKWYFSMDEKDHLWQDADGYHRVPCLIACNDGGWRWGLGSFGSTWRDGSVLLCFCDLD